MHALATGLALTKFESDVLWLLVCIELEPRVARATQLLGAPELNAQLLERLVTQGQTIEADIFERLRRFALIESSTGPASRRTIRVDEQVIDLARGRLALDRQICGFARLENAVEVRRSGPTLEVPDGFIRAAGSENAAIIASGAIGAGRATTLRFIASSQGRGAITVDATELSKDPEIFARQIRIIARECRLHAAWSIYRDADELLPAIERAMREMRDIPLLASSRLPSPTGSRRALSLELKTPPVAARAQLWNRVLPKGVSDECAHRYAISPGMIEACAAAARAKTANVQLQDVHEALRAQLDRRLSGLATRIETRQIWDDLVLPVDQMDLLIELVARVRHRERVLEDWGFADKIGRGLGLSALLSGPPGTGKTMIAGLLARELKLDLYQVDLSKLVSKYIGETEKQLAALFEAAESGQAIILFDEADSLFAKRTEVRSSNDRYANLEVNYLLQRIESFTGITLLTTNHETAIDPAFMRRLAFHIRVPMPDEHERELLWRTMLPAKAELDVKLDFGRLASEFAMTGGYIKNAVLRAAFLSADAGTVITEAHLLRGARAEYEAMGKLAHQS